jgi:phospho-N-acetylmuramoyl-pentapeptide-transferase
MALYLGLVIFSFLITSVAIVPFIDFLYHLHFTYHSPIPPTTNLEKVEFTAMQSRNRWKIGTPVGGGILLVFLVSLLFAFLFPLLSRLGLYIHSNYSLKEELNIIFFTFVSFGLLGLFDDIIKIFNLQRIVGKISGYRTVVKVILSFIVAILLYQNLGLNSIFLFPFGTINMGIWYIPVTAALLFIFSRAVNITDGIDGLAAGCLLIAFMAMWVISFTMLDTPISVFIALWVGALIAFLYFNVYPARIWLGNTGALSFGATFILLGILLGKLGPTLVIGGVFMSEFLSWAIQYFSVHILHRKIFSISPLHYFLESKGWPEPKISMRTWLISIILCFFGLWLS